jgi:hypothetical protein
MPLLPSMPLSDADPANCLITFPPRIRVAVYVKFVLRPMPPVRPTQPANTFPPFQMKEPMIVLAWDVMMKLSLNELRSGNLPTMWMVHLPDAWNLPGYGPCAGPVTLKLPHGTEMSSPIKFSLPIGPALFGSVPRSTERNRLFCETPDTPPGTPPTPPQPTRMAPARIRVKPTDAERARALCVTSPHLLFAVIHIR